MVCSVIDECRCYTYSDVPDPTRFQFCGVRRGPVVVACPEEECCDGGCPGEFPKEPFRILDRPKQEVVSDYRIPILIFLALTQLLVIVW